MLFQEERAKASRERGLIWAILILVAVVVALGLVYVKLNNDVATKRTSSRDPERRLAEVQQQDAELQALRDPPDAARGDDR